MYHHVKNYELKMLQNYICVCTTVSPILKYAIEPNTYYLSYCSFQNSQLAYTPPLHPNQHVQNDPRMKWRHQVSKNMVCKEVIFYILHLQGTPQIIKVLTHCCWYVRHLSLFKWNIK